MTAHVVLTKPQQTATVFQTLSAVELIASLTVFSTKTRHLSHIVECSRLHDVVMLRLNKHIIIFLSLHINSVELDNIGIVGQETRRTDFRELSIATESLKELNLTQRERRYESVPCICHEFPIEIYGNPLMLTLLKISQLLFRLRLIQHERYLTHVSHTRIVDGNEVRQIVTTDTLDVELDFHISLRSTILQFFLGHIHVQALHKFIFTSIEESTNNAVTISPCIVLNKFIDILICNRKQNILAIFCGCSTIECKVINRLVTNQASLISSV